MASNYQLTTKASQDRLLHLIEDASRQIVHLDKEIAEREQSRQSLMEMRAAMRDYSRLLALELVGK